MINSVVDFLKAVKTDLAGWDDLTKPWFRGESANQPALCPKISKYDSYQENYLLQSFRRQAGGLANVPARKLTDLWLFLAQHYGVPTRLLDWTEGALHALYFAINKGNSNPRVYMLNPQKLNALAGFKIPTLNYPLSWVGKGAVYVALAWQHRNLERRQLGKKNEPVGIDIRIPIAFPATYQDHRMIAQRSCFTIHGVVLKPIEDILKEMNIGLEEYLIEYKIDAQANGGLLKELSIMGISAATIFPDLDHLAYDLLSDLRNFSENQGG